MYFKKEDSGATLTNGWGWCFGIVMVVVVVGGGAAVVVVVVVVNGKKMDLLYCCSSESNLHIICRMYRGGKEDPGATPTNVWRWCFGFVMVLVVVVNDEKMDI
jgi:hypothetical protein